MPENGKVLRSIVLANPGFIFPEGNIQDPVEAVLNAPVSAHRFGQLFYLASEAAYVIAGFHTDLAVYIALSLDHDNGAEILPERLVRQPLNIGCCPITPGLDPAMVAVDCLAVVVGDVSEAR